MARTHLSPSGRWNRHAAASTIVVGALVSLSMAAMMTGSVTGPVTSASEKLLDPVGTSSTTTPGIEVSQTTGTTICDTSTCSNANLFGDSSAPLLPGRTRSIAMRFTNTGREAIATRTLVSGNCVTTASGAIGAATPTGTDTLCDALRLEVFEGVVSNGTRLYAGSPAALPTTITLDALAVHASMVYTFRVTLPADADSASQGQTITQPLTWTNNA